MRTITMLFVAAVLLASLSPVTAGEKTNYSGTWNLNNEKSQIGEGGGWMLTTKLTIKQEETKMTIDRVTKRRSGEETTSTEIITLDGVECQNTIGERQKTSAATWSEDGASLTISSKMVFEREGNKMEITSTEIWKLTEEGKCLSNDYTSQSPRGERKATYVYDKEK